MAPTEYVVLRKAGEGNAGEGRWEEVGYGTASSGTKAARTLAEDLDRGGEYVAVPVRSFASVLIEFDTVRRARVSIVTEEIPAFPEKAKEPAES